MTRLLALVLCLPWLGGCAERGLHEGLPRGWTRPYAQAALAERACYRTLAVVDCHAQALPGARSRRVGFFDAPVSPPVSP